MKQRLTLEDLMKAEPDVKRIGSTVPLPLFDKLNQFCDEHGVTQSEVIRAAVTNWLIDHGMYEEEGESDGSQKKSSRKKNG